MFKKIKKIAIVAACAVAASTMLTFAASASGTSFTENVGSPWRSFYGELFVDDSRRDAEAYSKIDVTTSTDYLRVGLQVVDYRTGSTIYDGTRRSDTGGSYVDLWETDTAGYSNPVSAYGSYELIDGSYANGHYLQLLNI